MLSQKGHWEDAESMQQKALEELEKDGRPHRIKQSMAFLFFSTQRRVPM